MTTSAGKKKFQDQDSISTLILISKYNYTPLKHILSPENALELLSRKELVSFRR